MPSNPDRARTAGPPARLLATTADSSDSVGFLDAADLEPESLAEAIRGAFGTLAPGAVITVYNHHPQGREAIRRLCDDGGLDLDAIIDHPTGGTTFTISSRPRPS